MCCNGYVYTATFVIVVFDSDGAAWVPFTFFYPLPPPPTPLPFPCRTHQQIGIRDLVPRYTIVLVSDVCLRYNISSRDIDSRRGLRAVNRCIDLLRSCDPTGSAQYEPDADGPT